MFASKLTKNLPHTQKAGASAGVVWPLSIAVLEDPVPISVEAWLELTIDQRAPPRSVAVIDLFGDRVVALVVDTIAGQLRFRICGRADQLVLLYRGMYGDDASSRGTFVISVPSFGAAPDATTISGEIARLLRTEPGPRQEPAKTADDGGAADCSCADSAVATPDPKEGHPIQPAVPSLIAQGAQLIQQAFELALVPLGTTPSAGT
jgi:hypothetical protein